MRASIFGLPTKCTFSSRARAAECGSRQKSRTPFYSMPRLARVWGISGPCACEMGALCFRLEIGKFNGPSFFQFLQQLRQASRGTGRRVVVISDNAPYHHSRLHKPWREQQANRFALDFLPPIAPNLIRSSECGSSHAVAACIIVTSKISKTSSPPLKRNLQLGQLATMFYADYAQLLKTLCFRTPNF